MRRIWQPWRSLDYHWQIIERSWKIVERSGHFFHHSTISQWSPPLCKWGFRGKGTLWIFLQVACIYIYICVCILLPRFKHQIIPNLYLNVVRVWNVISCLYLDTYRLIKSCDLWTLIACWVFYFSCIVANMQGCGILKFLLQSSMGNVHFIYVWTKCSKCTSCILSEWWLPPLICWFANFISRVVIVKCYISHGIKYK